MIIIATISQGYCEGYCWNTILKGLSHFSMSYEHRHWLLFVPGSLFKNVCIAKIKSVSSPQQRTGRDTIISERIRFCRLRFFSCNIIHSICRCHLAFLALLLGAGAQGTGTQNTKSLATAIARAVKSISLAQGFRVFCKHSWNNAWMTCQACKWGKAKSQHPHTVLDNHMSSYMWGA